MPKTLITADLHFSDNIRDAYRFEIVDRLIKLIRAHKAESLVILGDLTEAKERHNAWLTNRIVDIIVRLAKECFVVIVKGNHDYLADPNTPFFRFLDHLENVWWINEPQGAYSPLYLPHTRNYKEDWEGLDLSVGLIYTHNAFVGADLGNGFFAEVKHGAIPLDIIPKHTLVISGDIHKPQRLGNVIYVGAPYLIDFGDDYQPRVLLLDEPKWTVKSILLGGRQKRLVELNSIEELATVKANTGDILKVRIRLDPEDHAQWPKHQAAIRQWGEEGGYQVYQVLPLVEGAHPKSVPVLKHRSDEKIVRDYAGQHRVPTTTLKTGLKLL